MAQIDFPVSGAARSMGYRKDVFDRIGGFDNISSTLSGDDDLLIQKAAEEGFKTGTIINDRSFVFTKSKKSYKEYFDQIWNIL